MILAGKVRSFRTLFTFFSLIQTDPTFVFNKRSASLTIFRQFAKLSWITFFVTIAIVINELSNSVVVVYL